MPDEQTSGAARRVYFWMHHTGRYDGNTGVQRVVRALGMALAEMPDVEVVPVRWCSDREAIVRAEVAWISGFSRYGGPVLPNPAEAGVPVHLARSDTQHLHDAWLLIAEVTHFDSGAPDAPSVALPVALDYARYHGLHTAVVFYDLVPLREPGYESLVSAHTAYALALAAADLILPISRAAASDLEAWWREQGYSLDQLPLVRPVPLAAEMVGVPRVRAPGSPKQRVLEGGAEVHSPVRFLAVGTVEPRKNQLALMQAVNRLCRRRPELDIQLDVVGGLHHAVAADAQQEAECSAGHIRLHQYVPEAALRMLMRECDATAFLSLAEGFGLPIVESLWQGKPCLCSNIGSMAEIAADGGCLMVDPRDPDAIERALEQLAEDAGLRADLARAACNRDLTGWSDYARTILAEIDAAPPVRLLALIEGSIGGGEAVAAAAEALGVRALRHHWRVESQAILPGFRHSGDPSPRIGRGYIRGLWALLPLASARGPAEAMQIRDEARGLGLQLAVMVEHGRLLSDADLLLLADVDLALFASTSACDAALDFALRTVTRTATLRYRFRVASNIREALGMIAAERPRISVIDVPQRPTRVFYWTGLTATQRFNTGIQRVVRSLGRALAELGVQVIPVKWDSSSQCMATLEADEAAILADWGGPAASQTDKLPNNLAGEWLIVPEVAVPVVPPGSSPAAIGRSVGMRVAAIFYDLMPLKMESVYPPGTTDAFSQYWAMFADSDVALPISWTAAADLHRYLFDRGLRIPPIVPCPLAGDLAGNPRHQLSRRVESTDGPFRLLAIGTWEPRKNYPRLLRALTAARRQARGRPIHLTVVGRRAGYTELDAEISRLAIGAGDIALYEHLSDEVLLELFARTDATVFSSCEEGFGLPVLESLWHGLPCLCHHGSAMAEVTPGGGVLAIDMLDEASIAHGIARLANEPALTDRLYREAVARPVRSWEEYSRDILWALSRTGTAPGWPLPAILSGTKRPLLSCAITTYNRAPWLALSLPRLIEAARPFRDRVEVVVCDNASTDATPGVVAQFVGAPGFSSHRNPSNVGMVGSFGATAQVSNGAYIWVLGDDDLIIEGAIESVLSGLEQYPDVEMAYMNYACTNFDKPEQLSNSEDIVRTAKSIGHGGPNRRVAHLREVAALNENLFTAIYACAFRRDHALRAYQQDFTGPPFSSLLTCVPSSVYALAALQDRPAWWVGRPAVVVNMNVSWRRWALLWHLERMPDLFDMAEMAGIDRVRVDRHRVKHCSNVGEWAHMALMQAEDAIREGFSMARLIERCKHIEAFVAEIPKLRMIYAEAWAAGRVTADRMDPDALFAHYGV